MMGTTRPGFFIARQYFVRIINTTAPYTRAHLRQHEVRIIMTRPFSGCPTKYWVNTHFSPVAGRWIYKKNYTGTARKITRSRYTWVPYTVATLIRTRTCKDVM